MIGSAHRGPLGRILLGSTGESMLSGAPGGIAVAPLGYADGEQGAGANRSGGGWIGAVLARASGGCRPGRTGERSDSRIHRRGAPSLRPRGSALAAQPEEYEREKENEAESILDEAMEQTRME